MPSRPRFWVIADDLTGALDTAAPFAAHGWRTCVVPWPGATARAIATVLQRAAATHDAVVVDTASRHVAAREAARRVRAVAVVMTAGASAGARPASAMYKKIDSTLRGNVAAELAAFRAVAGVDRLPIAPAFPAQGRTTRRGAVWVDGQPLRASAAARDALGPARSGAIAGLAPPGRLEVFDAASDADLRRVVGHLARTDRLGATAGSAGLAGAIAARLGGSPRAPARPAIRGPVLVVCGSAQPLAHAQAQALVQGGALGLVAPVDTDATPRDRAITAHVAAAALRGGRTVVLVCPPLPEGARVAPRRAVAVAQRLADTARRVIDGARPDAVVSVGGDTTAALAARMRWAPLPVAGAVSPGIALVRLSRASRSPLARGPRWLITKSGGFGDPSTLRRLLRRLSSAPARRRASIPR